MVVRCVDCVRRDKEPCAGMWGLQVLWLSCVEFCCCDQNTNPFGADAATTQHLGWSAALELAYTSRQRGCDIRNLCYYAEQCA